VLFVPYLIQPDGASRLVVLAGMCAALAVRRLSPALSLAIVWVPSLWQVLFWMGPDPTSIAILPVLYATSRYGTDVVKWAGLISAGVGAIIITVYLTIQRFSWLAECMVSYIGSCHPDDFQ